jgi:hypothetical protein
MRPVGGFDRPVLQWLFVALGLALILAAAAEAVGLRRARTQIEALRAADLNRRLERQQLEARVAREQAARESLTLEIARLRGGNAAGGAPTPTLTLTPLKTRGATPPPPTVAVPAPAQAIELRLVLGAAPQRAKSYAITLRRWSGGEVVWSRGGLEALTVEGKPMVTARITGDVLTAGAYELALTANTPEGSAADVASYELAVGSPPR